MCLAITNHYPESQRRDIVAAWKVFLVDNSNGLHSLYYGNGPSHMWVWRNNPYPRGVWVKTDGVGFHAFRTKQAAEAWAVVHGGVPQRVYLRKVLGTGTEDGYFVGRKARDPIAYRAFEMYIPKPKEKQ